MPASERRRRRVAASGAVLALLAAGAVVLGTDGSSGAAGDPGAVTTITAADAGTTPGAGSCALPAPGTHRVVVDAQHPAVVLHVPPGLSGRPPLIVVLPGSGQHAQDIASYTGYSRLADRERFEVAYPTATGGARPSWNVSGNVPGKPDDVAYLRQAIAALTGPAGCADPARVGMTGVSNGGGMTARMACDAAGLLAAVAPVAGGYSSLPTCRPERPLPVLEVHGLKDTVVPYAGKAPDGAGAVGPFLDGWRRRDGCPGRASRSQPAANVLELRWTCAGGRQVVHDRVLDAEHGWPGEASLRPFSSTLRTAMFLLAFRNADAAAASR